MDGAQIGWIVFIVLIFGFRYYLKSKRKGYRREYSLGLKSAEEIQSLIKAKDFKEAESLAQKQDLNDITQIVDHLALSLNEELLLEWEASEKSDFSKLVLGVYYLHFAWITRGHSFADEVSDDDAKGFFDYLQLCSETFNSIPEDSFYKPELTSREIRLGMSLGNNELAHSCFQDVSEKHPDFIWPYIQYSEFIQPKWGGDIAGIEKFYESLPDDFLIKSIVELKLILDGRIMNDYYFKKYNENVNEFECETILKIDKEFDLQTVDSVHKYVLYNYMVSVAVELNLNELKKKYKSLRDSNFTLYPHGVLR